MSLISQFTNFYFTFPDLIDIESYEENMSECDGPLIPQSVDVEMKIDLDEPNPTNNNNAPCPIQCK